MDVMAEGAPVWARPEDLGPETVVDDDLQLLASNDRDAIKSDGWTTITKKRRRKPKKKTVNLVTWLEGQNDVDQEPLSPQLPSEEASCVIEVPSELECSPGSVDCQQSSDVDMPSADMDMPSPESGQQEEFLPTDLEDPVPAELEESALPEEEEAQLVPNQADHDEESHEVAEASESDEEWNFIPGSDNKENLPPRSADEAAVPETGSNEEEELAEDLSRVAEEDDDMESGLNPDAAEFVPFGVKSPTRDTDSSDFSPIPAVAACLDDVIASSPAKGSERSIDDIDVPSEGEFDAEIASRPADLDLDSSEMNGKEEAEEEDLNPFVANNDVNDVLSSPTTPPAGVVEFATGEQAPLAFQTADTSGQPPLNFQPFDNSQPLVSMSAEISSHFNFIDSHLAPEDDQPCETREQGEFDFDGLVMSKNHFIHEAEENKIEEDARESETLGKSDADTPADIMITSFHEGLGGTLGDEPPLSQKELLVGDEKHFMDKEDNPRTTSDLDSSFEVVQSRPEESADDAAASEDEVIDHGANETGLTDDFSHLQLQSPTVDCSSSPLLTSEIVKERHEEAEHQTDLVEADLGLSQEVEYEVGGYSEKVSHEQVETRSEEAHFTDNFFTQSEKEDQPEAEQAESQVGFNNLHEDSETGSNLVNESETTTANPFHEESSFSHMQFNSQNPFEAEPTQFAEEKVEEVGAVHMNNSHDMFEDDALKTNEEHFSDNVGVESEPASRNEILLAEEEPKQVPEPEQVNEVSHFTETVSSYDSPFVEESAVEEPLVESSLAAVEDVHIEPEVVQEHVDTIESNLTAVEPPVVEPLAAVETVESPIVDETPLIQTEQTPVEEEVVKASESQLVQIEATAPEVEAAVPQIETLVPEVVTSVPEVETPVPEVETSVPEVVTSVSEIETPVPEIETTSVPEIETAVPEIQAQPVETPTETPLCNGTSGHTEELVSDATETPAETVAEASSVIPAVSAAIGVGAVAATVGAAVKAATAKGKVEAKPSAASKTAAKPSLGKSAPTKPATTAAAKKPASAPATKTAAKPSVASSAAAKPKAAAPSKPAAAAKAAPAAKPASAKPSIGAASKPASATAAKTAAAKPAASGARPASAATKAVPAARPTAAARPASAAAKPAAPKPAAAARPAAPAAKTTAAKPATAARPAAAKPATTAAKPASAGAKPAGTASSLAAKKPAAPGAKPLAAKAPAAKPAAAKPAGSLTKTAPIKRPASSTAPVKKPSGSLTAKKVESPKKVVNGGPHIDDLPGKVSSSSNGHLESPPIATH